MLFTLAITGVVVIIVCVLAQVVWAIAYLTQLYDNGLSEHPFFVWNAVKQGIANKKMEGKCRVVERGGKYDIDRFDWGYHGYRWKTIVSKRTLEEAVDALPHHSKKDGNVVWEEN